MARTGKRAAVLRRMLTEAGLRQLVGQLPRPDGTAFRDELLRLYRTLGGLSRTPVWRPGGWDLVFEGPLVVELDEQLHFNRYRATTLSTSWSTDLPWLDAYRAHCAEYEARCLRDGCSQQRWTNPSCARDFSGGVAGDLDAGAPRWKQRAFYDTLKDTVSFAGFELAIARVAIYDTVKGRLLDDVLDGRAAVDPAAVLALVLERTVVPRPIAG